MPTPLLSCRTAKRSIEYPLDYPVLSSAIPLSNIYASASFLAPAKGLSYVRFLRRSRVDLCVDPCVNPCNCSRDSPASATAPSPPPILSHTYPLHHPFNHYPFRSGKQAAGNVKASNGQLLSYSVIQLLFSYSAIQLFKLSVKIHVTTQKNAFKGKHKQK